MRLHTYHLLTDSPAKKKAKKLIEIVALMGFDIKLSRAQELVARLMGYGDWSELLRTTRAAPERGVPDQMLPPKAATERREFQIALLAREFSIEASVAETLLEALVPTGESRGVDWSMIEKLGLRLNDEDLAWFEESMALVREFDSAVRPLYALSNYPGNGLTHVRLETVVPGRRKLSRRTTTPDDIVNWVANCFPENAPLAGELLAEVKNRAKMACQSFSALDARIRALGAAPMVAPVNWTFLMLFRAHWSTGSNSFYSAINPEPWLHIGFDLPGFCFNPENEWNASRALALQMALRREFLDSGWTSDGDVWEVTFRDGNSAKEDIKVRAKSAGAACAWASAARGALRIAKQQTVSSVSLISVVGPDGSVEPEQALSMAVNESVIRRGKLIGATKLRGRGRRKAA
ncbi:MAG: hypothetical protein WAW54_10845 [Parvibaculum sedimenti]|uniref:hypothetical protein n=1 Tax=Parvibaculum sedimenti TaxID=2608632 RepID=UPI003BB70E77